MTTVDSEPVSSAPKALYKLRPHVWVVDMLLDWAVIIGAVVFNYLKTYAVGVTVYWQLLLGTVLIVLVLALPTGITGSMARLAWKIKEVGQK